VCHALRLAPPTSSEFREIDTPVPTDNKVLVRVHAAGLDRGMWHVTTRLPYLIRFVVPTLRLRKPEAPFEAWTTPGHVEAVGEHVTRFQPGDAVLGWTAGWAASTATCARWRCHGWWASGWRC
jgi:NADPH:quinone reductase-like Zn-dependent oxidoreductase